MSVFVIYLIYYIYKGLGYLWIRNLPNTPGYCHFSSGDCCVAGIFVRTLEHDGLDNFSIISFRMLLAALITGIWILFYNRHLFYVHRRDFWLFIGSGNGSAWPPSVSFIIFPLRKDLLHFLPCYLPCPPVFGSVSGCYILPWTSNQTQTDLCNTALIGCVLVSGVLESNGLSWSITGILCGILASFFMLYMES